MSFYFCRCGRPVLWYRANASRGGAQELCIKCEEPKRDCICVAIEDKE